MKNFKKFTATIAATLMAASLSVPMFASVPVGAADITITGISESQEHTFEVYQVFTGDLSAGVLSNLKWGSGVAQYGANGVTPGSAVDEAIITELTEITSNKGSDIVDKFTLNSTKACSDVTSSGDSVTISGLTDGYYIVKDVTDLGDADDANSAWIVQVAGNANIAIKNAKPTVDKQVLDETGDAESGASEGWGESADHAINESFQFKLKATIPADNDLAAYETYKLVFNDTMSAGVTFESIASVKVGDTVISAYDADTAPYGYVVSGVSAGDSGKTWTLTIADLKKHVTNLSTGATVEVIYNAHLNENAVVHNSSAENTVDTNKNTVTLSYSNNPDSTGAGTTDGKTPEDTVWVFTYKVDNTKYKDSVAEGNKLAGAEFKLYESDGSTEVKLVYDNTKNAYRPATASETPTVMTSAESTGMFNIIGLDAGKYVLRETKTPDGYNTCADIDITIQAAHVENAGGTSVNLNLTGSNNMNNSIINKSGSALPSTGGIGTTLFYIGGGCMVGLAGIFLITKKRMGKKDE